uniref:RRM domain-containing protein n=1 Tax=Panagrellus redivivus TaxID=6233 RepID=A0A7E4W0Y3_PANRE
MAMATNTDNNTSPRPSVEHGSEEHDVDGVHDESPQSTMGQLFAQDTEIGDWSDLQDTETAADIPETNYPAVEENTQVPFSHELGIVLGHEVMRCQLPDHPPYHALVFDLPESVSEEELYMLFGGKRAIDSFTHRRDLREVLFKFRQHEHLVDAFFKQNMIFKDKPLSLALILMDSQIKAFHRHCREHHDLDALMVPFKGAFNMCYERQDDGSLTQLFDDIVSADSDTVSSISIAPSKKGPSNDVRASQGQFQTASGGFPRSRADSTNSITSMRSILSEQSTNRSTHHSPPESENIPHQGSLSRQSSVAAPVEHKPKANPFGDAKPVNTRDKELKVQARISSQRQSTDSEPSAQALPDVSQPPPAHPTKFNHLEHGAVKIQKRPQDAPAHQQGTMQWVNSNIQKPPKQQHDAPVRHPNPSHIQIDDEVIDTSKPPPAFKPDFKPRGGKQGQNPRFYKEGGHVPREHRNNFHNTNGVNYNQQYSQQQQQHGNHHSNLPPAGPNRSHKYDERKKSGGAKMEKSKSVPVSTEPQPHPQVIRKNSPIENSNKRPNSANSSMSFVTASEMSSNPSGDLPGVPGSMESINERSDGADEHRRHSWESRRNQTGKKGNTKNRNKKSNTATDLTQPGNADSRRSSTSTPQYQSASNVFIEGEVQDSTTSHDTSRHFDHKVPHHKIKREGRAPSLPLSRPHTASNETESTSSKIDFDDDKPDSMSAPPTPSGSAKKKTDSRKKRGSKLTTALHGNKFRALADAPE